MSHEEFDIFTESNTIIPSPCPETITNIRDSIAMGNDPITSERFYFLSEIEDLIGGVNNLPCFLRAVAQLNPEFNHATLIIDKVCTLSEPLIIPQRFTIAGSGIEGEGRIIFTGLRSGDSAILLDIDNQPEYISIRDLFINYSGSGQVIGIDVSRGQQIYIKDCRINDFHIGIYGSRPNTSCISVYIDHCNVHNNFYNLVLDHNAFHWRIRDCIFNQAQSWGMVIFNMGGNDHLVSGCRFEGCGAGGAIVGSLAAMFTNNRFEQNGGVGGIGIAILATATSTRLISNLFSSNVILDHSNVGETQEWGSIPPRNIIRSDFVLLRIRSKLGSNESSLPESNFPFIGNSVEKEFHIDGIPQEGYIIIQLYNVNAEHRILVNGKNLPEHDILVNTKGWTIWTDEIPNGILVNGPNSIRIEAIGNDNFAIRHIILQWRGVQI